MAHIQIHANPRGAQGSDDPVFRMVVDGVDITSAVLGDGFSIEWPDDLTYLPAIVNLRLSADVLDLDLSQSLLDAIVTKAGA